MIRYRLQCSKSHQFEAWFPSSEGFEKQASNGLVTCPRCGSTRVEKTLMAPSVVTSERKAAARVRRKAGATPPVEVDAAPVATAAPPAQELVLNGPQREMLKQLKSMRDKILAEAEYVGPRFADEARKIHQQETPARGIYGEASPREVKELAEEGIDVFPVPALPEDQN
ncbi:MAG: DUF1178 family protein [Hyphomicrobiaceae bacterium]|nr:DUF1178 family protein [Hyphomicrobiaceae bacterium]